MSEVVPPCDVVIVGQILVHLRDPLGALHQAALAAKETLVIVEGIPEGPSPDIPVAYFLGGQVLVASVAAILPSATAEARILDRKRHNQRLYWAQVYAL